MVLVGKHLGTEVKGTPRRSGFEVCWWNGGGGLLKRLKVNPVLKNLLNQLPDIFIYGESGMSTKSGLFLKGYNFIFPHSGTPAFP